MASEVDRDGSQAPPRVSSLRPPPKPVRPRAGPAPAQVPPPLPATSPVTSGASAQSAQTAPQAPKSQEATGKHAPRAHFAKIALVIFAAGVLVGVGVSALVMKSRTPRAAEVAKPRALAAAAPRASAAHGPPALATRATTDEGLAAKVPAVEATPQRAAATKVADAPKVEEESRAVTDAKEPARETSPPPAPSFDAPSCQQVTGFFSPKSANTKAAERETRIANRQLMLGNVANAQLAYCRALAWNRSNIDRHVNLARLFLVRRDWKQAAEYGQSALKLDPKSRAALGVVGDAWAALGKTKEARAAWLAAEGMTKASSRQLGLIVRRNMALAWRVERLKDLLLAERLYRRVLLLQPEHVGATKGIASCLLKAGSYRAAEAWARRADALPGGKHGRAL